MVAVIIRDQLHEAKIIRQVYFTKPRNMCTIYDNIIMLDVHGKYVVEVIRKYSDSNTLDFRYRSEFDDLVHANFYFDTLMDK